MADRKAGGEISVTAASFQPESVSNDEPQEQGYSDVRTSGAVDPHLDELLDRALEETFPASDPVSIFRRGE
jgi:hypothetical protein